MTELTLLPGGQVPAHIAARTRNSNTDLASGVSAGFGQISYKGKVWHLVESGVRNLITDPTTGDPRTSLEVVIVKANPAVSKVYYPGGYVEGTTDKPTCYSNDGKAPAQDSEELQATSCAVCPHNQWGSRITEAGTKGKACADSRRLAVVAPPDLAMGADEAKLWLLRVPAASLKELMGYADQLNRHGAPYTAVVTKVSFDHSVAHPKLQFKALRWLDETEVGTVEAMQGRDVVSQIIGGFVNPEEAVADHGIAELGPRPAALVAPEPEPKPAPAKAKPKPGPAAAAASVTSSGFGGVATPVAETTAPVQADDEDGPIVSDASLDAALEGLDD